MVSMNSGDTTHTVGNRHSMDVPLKPSITVSAEVYRRLPLDALRDVFCELEAVVTPGVDRCHSIDGRSAIRTENPGMVVSSLYHK